MEQCPLLLCRPVAWGQEMTPFFQINPEAFEEKRPWGCLNFRSTPKRNSKPLAMERHILVNHEAYGYEIPPLHARAESNWRP